MIGGSQLKKEVEFLRKLVGKKQEANFPIVTLSSREDFETMDPELAWSRVLTAECIEGCTMSVEVDRAPDYAHQACLLDDLPSS